MKRFDFSLEQVMQWRRLRAEDRTIGVVNVKHRSQKERYGPAQVESLTHVASEIAGASHPSARPLSAMRRSMAWLTSRM